MGRRFLLALLILLALPEAANAVVCGTSMTLNTNGVNTANYGQNVVSALTYPCLTILDPAGANALGINASGQIAISNATFGATLNAAPSLANGNGVVPTVGGAAVAAGNPLPISLGTGAILEVSPTAVANSSANPFYVQAIPGTTGGTSTFSEIVANNTTSVAVKAGPGQIYGIRVFSNNTTPVYGKLFNLAQGSVTCGTTSGPLDRFEIPAQTGGSGFVVPIPYGQTYSTAITLCMTGGIADNDATAPGAAAYLVSIDFK